jgi:hypothetical protein
MTPEPITETKPHEAGRNTPKCLLRWTVDPETGKPVARWSVDKSEKIATSALLPAA